jgi:hypothetical protein
VCPIGRPTIPIETYLRLTYLKHRHGLGCETTALQVEGWCRGSHQSSQTPLWPESDTSRGLHRRPDLGRQSGADAIPATHDLAYSASGFSGGSRLGVSDGLVDEEGEVVDGPGAD